MKKRGVSEIIGYVLLISITLVIAAMIFFWLRGTVVDTIANEEVSCENDIALVLKDYSYDCDSGVLNLTIQNRGLFNIEGFTTKVSNVSGASVGDYLLNKVGEKIAVTETASQNFNSLPGVLTLVDIQAYKIQDGKTVYCKDAIVKQEIDCREEEVCDDVFYLDKDKDTYGNSSNSIVCSASADYVSRGGDCNDSNESIKPGAIEVCDGKDNDCDGKIDVGLSGNYLSRSTGQQGMCSANKQNCSGGVWVNFTTNYIPGLEICDPGRADENCVNGQNEGCSCTIGNTTSCYSGSLDTKNKGRCSNGTQTCNSSGQWGVLCAGEVLPSPTGETCNDIDDDCDGTVDEDCDDDNDNYCDSSMIRILVPATCTSGGGDCNDNNVSIHPGATEVCNGLDNNCNGLIDDNKICCIDSDGGKKYYQKGNITYFDLMTLTWKVNNDWCKGSDLREFSCVGDGITDAYAYSMSVKSCGYGCYDGACIAVGGFA